MPLPEKFGKAMERAMGASENMLMERKWKDEGLRYGDRREVSEVIREISAVYDEKTLKRHNSDRFSSFVTDYQSYQRSKDVDSPLSGGPSRVDKNS